MLIFSRQTFFNESIEFENSGFHRIWRTFGGISRIGQQTAKWIIRTENSSISLIKEFVKTSEKFEV